MLGLGTAQESPQQQLADLKGYQVLENVAYGKLLSKKFVGSSSKAKARAIASISPMLAM